MIEQLSKSSKNITNAVEIESETASKQGRINGVLDRCFTI